MNGRLRHLLIIFVSFIAALGASLGGGGCEAPVGSIGGSHAGTIGDVNKMVVVPARDTYRVNDLFLRQQDLSVLGIDQSGYSTVISAEDVNVGIAEDPDKPDDTVPDLADEDSLGYLFKNSGRKIITVTYSTMEYRYSVDVQDPYGIGGEDGGSGGGEGGTGIGIIWADEVEEEETESPAETE